MSESGDTTECAIAIIDGRIGLALKEPDREAIAVVLSPREADRLASRLRKAASDLRAAKARER